jgi:hypothetical protein
LTTVTWTLPTAEIKLAGTCAVSCMAETKVVVRFVPFQLTSEAEMKLVPFTVSVNAAPPAVAVLGEIELTDGAGLFAWVMVKVAAVETPPPGAGLLTVTCAEPTVAMSLARIAAVS